jgi:putative NIF3 family GTP cyclohydrolase 1 type 2
VRGAQRIITHHPIMFRARKNLREDAGEGALLAELLRARLALIAAHTNYDNAPGGLNDALAAALGLQFVETLPRGLRAGAFSGDPEALVDRAKERLGGAPRLYRGGKAPESCAVRPEALKAGCDAFLTGEVRHSDALAAVQAGLTVIDAGHYQTERVMVKALRNGLQTRANMLQYNVHVFESGYEPF